MGKRRGRPRKSGARYRSGDLKRHAETPRMVAATMPHRRALGEQAADQRAETELGRLVLRGDLGADLGLAGASYAALWRGYVFTISGPAQITNAGGHGLSCDGCPTWPDGKWRGWCRCRMRRKIYKEARKVLDALGSRVTMMVERTVIDDLPGPDLGLLRLGLGALALHFGLTPRQTVILGNAASDTASSPA